MNLAILSLLLFSLSAVADTPTKHSATKKHTAKTPAPKTHYLNVKRFPAKAKKKEAPKAAPPVVAPSFPQTVPYTVVYPSQNSTYAREFNSGYGLFLMGDVGISLTNQIRFHLSEKKPWYFGFEASFVLMNLGTILLAYPAVWYDFRIGGGPLALLSVGLLVGAGFPNGVPNFPTQAFSAFGDLNLSFEIDDLTTVRGQFRPGIVGGNLAFTMAVLVGFRFH